MDWKSCFTSNAGQSDTRSVPPRARLLGSSSFAEVRSQCPMEKARTRPSIRCGKRFATTLAASAASRYPLVLSDRKLHLDRIATELIAGADAPAVFRLESGMGKRQRQALHKAIERKTAGGERFV